MVKVGATSTPSTTEPTKRNFTTFTRDLCTYRQVAITKQQFIMYTLKLSHIIFMYKFNGFSLIRLNVTSIGLSVFAWHFATETKQRSYFDDLTFNSYKRYITNRSSLTSDLRTFTSLKSNNRWEYHHNYRSLKYRDVLSKLPCKALQNINLMYILSLEDKSKN